MMDMAPRSRDDELKAERLRLVKVSMLGAPGAILAAFGLFGKFDDSAVSLFAPLGNETVTSVMIGAGAAIMLWEGMQVWKIKLRIGELERQDQS